MRACDHEAIDAAAPAVEGGDYRADDEAVVDGGDYRADDEAVVDGEQESPGVPSH
jgi:hypothetical protein